MEQAFHSLLYQWYGQNGRKTLPWRNTKDAYAILVSEVMLQQTQVKTVLERYYTPFLEAFPTLEALASAPIEEVLKQWQGLGYYSRAVNLHKAARQSSPKLPDSVEQLLTLPGIGKNTAHAVAAFAYHQPVPVMEANVKRILYRVFALRQATERRLWPYAEQLLDSNNPFMYNQAMMDIGAMVCTKTNPNCRECPLHILCKGKNNPGEYPAKKEKKTIPVRYKNIIVFSYSDSASEQWFYVSPRETRFLGGLFGFQEYTKDKPIIFFNQHYLLSKKNYLGNVQQAYSHFKLDAEVYHIIVKDNLGIAPEFWKTLNEVQGLPLSKADEKVVTLLNNKLLKQAA